MKRFVRNPMILLFSAATLALSAWNLATPLQEYSELENRYLAQPPTFSPRAMLDSGERGFARRFETFVNDQFVLRDGWITLKSLTEAALAKTENNDIVYGGQGYLFAKYRSFDRARLEKNVALLAQFAGEHPDVGRYVMVVPASDSVLPHLVPEGLGNVDQAAEIQAVYEWLSSAGYQTVDAAGALLAHADEEIYYRTDHHWTTLGARYAADAFARAAGLPPPDAPEALRRTSEGFFGTYFSRAKKFDAIPDTLVWYDYSIGAVTVDGKAADGMYDRSQLLKRDQYAMFLYANNGLTTLQNPGAPPKSLLVVKDSYANCLAPFLTRLYADVTVADLRSLPQGLSALMAEREFDDVLVLYSFSNLASDANLPRIAY